jgi:hypothetical protein
MQVVNLQHQYHLLAESLTKTKTSLDDEDNFEIDDEPQTVYHLN